MDNLLDDGYIPNLRINEREQMDIGNIIGDYSRVEIKKDGSRVYTLIDLGGLVIDIINYYGTKQKVN